mgnify:CR=1 FL=1
MNQKGITFIELVISLAILSILASITLPLAKMTVKRTKEIELRRDLREIRQSIDKYKENYEKELYGRKDRNKSGYPASIYELVEKRLLRRIPVDPMTGGTVWGTRSYSDTPGTIITDGTDVFDVFTASEDTAIDGTRDNTW